MADFAYDLLDYPAHVHPQMHPARLAAIARLHGLRAASPADCDLLEVGCGDGLQLIVLALAYPRSRFTGIDLSQAAIARGEAMRRRLGLDNLRLLAADFTAWAADPGGYDYITAHGFWSWVPESVRQHLLATCAAHLRPHAVAYISYNALPGCHLRRILRDVLLHGTRQLADPHARLAQAQALLRWLAEDVLRQREGYAGVVLREAHDLLARTDAAVIFHDDLAATNDPIQFSDFMAQAEAHGLAFLAEADYHESDPRILPDPAARARLQALAGGDRLQQEQYLDFLKGRRFRQTLLCHAAAGARIEPDAAALPGLHAVGDLRLEPLPAQADPLAAQVPLRCLGPDGAELVVDHPLTKAVLQQLAAAWPQPRPVADLLATAAARLHVPPAADDTDAALAALLAGVQTGLLQLLCDPPAFVATPGERPCASPLVRLQLEAGADLVASLRPAMVRLDSHLTCELLRLLDGQRDHAALLRDLAARMAALPADTPDAPPPGDVAGWQARLAPILAQGLQQAARLGLLVA